MQQVFWQAHQRLGRSYDGLGYRKDIGRILEGYCHQSAAYRRSILMIPRLFNTILK
jgi:hypothetical protein